MTDWPVKALSEVAVLNPSEPALSEDAPFVPMDAVTAGKREVQYTQPRGQRSGARARAGDILFARITPCLQNGKVALIQDEIERCGGSTEFIVVRAGPDVLPGFLYQWMTAEHVRDHVTMLMKGTTGRQRLDARDLALTELPVPPLEEQQRTVALLDDATTRINDLTVCYEQARTHANNLFTSALRADLEGNPDWPVKTLGEVCEVLDSLRKPITKRNRKAGNYPYFGATGIVDYVDDYIFDERLVLVGEDGAKWGSGERTAFIAEGKYWVNNHAHVLRCKSAVVVDSWLSNFLTMSDLNKYVSGLTVPKLNQGSLVSIEIPVPPLEEQKRIVARMDQMRTKTSEMVASYDAKLQAAKNLRQSILEAAFAGEL